MITTSACESAAPVEGSALTMPSTTSSSSPRAYTGTYNSTATPFNWTFTANDLDDLLARIDAHEHPERSKDTPLTQQAA